jgi:DNA polymerase-3 subunit alpha
MNQQNKQEYCPLHLHSQYSIDSVTSIKELHKYASDMGFEALAITDHASLAGVVEHYQYGLEHGIKSIQGCEIYLYWDNAPFSHAMAYSSGKKRIAHLTVLCDGEKGYETITRLVNKAKLRAEYGFRSPVYLSELIADNEGLYILSGCPASFAQDEDKKLAFEFVRILESAFGKRLFIEAQFHNLTTPRHFERAIELHEEFGIDIVYTNDCHYLDSKNVIEYQRFKKWVFGGKDDEDENFSLTMLYLASSDEIINHTKQISSLTGKDFNKYIGPAMAKSLEIARMLEIVDMSARKPIFPPVPNADKMFDDMIEEGIKKRGIDINDPVYSERLQQETKVIRDKGFVPYFCVVGDMCHFARDNGLVQGVGRGSAAGSLVSYILYITHLDPIKYGLTFERFLSEHRNALPDIDSDFSGEGRDRIIEFAGRKYGMKAVATYVYFGAKEALNFSCKHCDIPYTETEALKLELEQNGIFLEEWDINDPTPSILEKFFKKHAGVRLREMYEFVLNKAKSIGQHPGGIVYVDDSVPLEIKKNGGIVVGLPEGKHGEYLSHRGYVKVDILGISTLEVLQDCFNNVGTLPPEPNGVEPAIDLLNKGENAGIFQFKGSTMTSLLNKFKPKTFIDLVVLNGAGRGGADTDLYLELRDNGKTLNWGNEIDEICKTTLGVPIFQEQFMHIYAWLLDTVFDDPLGRVDKMRKSIAKFRASPDANKKKQEFKKEIISLATGKGLDKEHADLLWNFFNLAHGYSFNLAHSTCYSYIAWQLLWYKYNHPLFYQSATLNACYTDEMQRSVNELQRQGIEIVEPDICNSQVTWVTNNNKIYAPFTIIKGLGDLAAMEIVKTRPYTSASEFMQTVNLRRVNAGIRYKLYMCGAFDCFPDITGDVSRDMELLDIEKYDVTVDKAAFKQKIYEVIVFDNEKMREMNDHIDYLLTIVDTNNEQKVVSGTIGEIAKEKSKNPKLSGDRAIQYKLRDTGGKFIAWFSEWDLKGSFTLSILKEGVTFSSITSYGRVLPETVKVF